MTAGQAVALPPIPDPPRTLPSGVVARRMRAMLVCGVLFVILGGLIVPLVTLLPMWIAGGASPLADLILNQRQVPTIGTLVQKELLTSIHVNDRNPWRLQFEFRSEAGDLVRAVGFSYDASWAAFEPGSALEVQYDPLEPARARPADGLACNMPLWVFALVLLTQLPLPIIGASLLVIVRIKGAQLKRLLQYGVGAVGEVLGIRQVWYVNFGTKHPYDVYYRFVDHNGRFVQGTARTYNYAWAEAHRPGDRIALVFNPYEPTQSTLWLHGRELETALEPAWSSAAAAREET